VLKLLYLQSSIISIIIALASFGAQPLLAASCLSWLWARPSLIAFVLVIMLVCFLLLFP
jgi:hypothetical protein